MSNATDSENPIERRRFGLRDVLILMVALAVSLERFRALRWFGELPRTLGWFWQTAGQLGGWVPWPHGTAMTRGQLQTELFARLVTELLQGCCPVLLGLTVAQPLLRLLRPRPALADLVRQSGFVTCLIVITLVGLLLVSVPAWFTGLALTLPITRGMILFSLWPLLALPPWRAEASWIDRLGRVVGWGWIAALIGGAVLERLGAI